MDFDMIEEKKDSVIVRNVENFELKDIFDCGQCFRWHRQENGNYIGIAFEKVVEVQKIGEDVVIYNINEEEFKNVWSEYFDLYRDYGEIKKELSRDPLLKKSVDFGEGIRILRQDPFEILLSFIISANNRIPMIKKCINNISEKAGKKLEYKGKIYYAFPTVDKLHEFTEKDFEECTAGFRAKYLKDTVDRIYNGELNLEYIKSLNDNECHEELKKFMGVGPKVADCIMLFSMQKYSAFPVDTWVKKAMMSLYVAPDVSLKKIRDFGREKFGSLSGFAQQYLFYYARENNIQL
ncbi:N-glycosylase/DNA lyase [Clostridium acetobutylicum]|uniref:DNA-(apurinic or apyrimidinic site) lyase n=1 Tax=Clostridium acetobutylicum (strain ATCC 824 / DSM 792 / JCM 1419 / IAM 19013 / LMG 5710 / NBRC 13948 / NRRL B-527 / VKM B-1787 / 2291 / W) TaxID=272562 RepID=Q97FM4_CLOAB|nr:MULTISPECIES: DNA-3-methyladenine glycosylase [Clostridium]AAK80653.1 8-oxoguanine-DNA-glycosylase [Clostridium acetobutylicum ATCC 824]ADZ21752.1 8-oxoguanine-DNA-glycosylase [Clostridium acetobutylicum EA 2018]AEI32510.1 8-oxoguanine-DNA-glycosylase [Clostridium acetobutylicum DSM 1731]AWV78932.1 DNA-3-methyladenine glycosylase 2 family protein [Clostridium acetobutylicum]MBC2395170.1 DNA-3-methyladenine glycosylase 2 family protein [Clostridium acetobutylicum]